MAKRQNLLGGVGTTSTVKWVRSTKAYREEVTAMVREVVAREARDFSGFTDRLLIKFAYRLQNDNICSYRSFFMEAASRYTGTSRSGRFAVPAVRASHGFHSDQNLS